MPKCPYCPDGWHVICPCDDFDDCDYKDKLRKKYPYNEDEDYPDKWEEENITC